MTWVVVGLGNPGERYASTRHNIGQIALDVLALRDQGRFKKVRFIPVDAAEVKIAGERALLAKSHAFMNESGPSYASLVKRAKADADHVICVHDEIDLPFGTIRVKQGGGSTHNGVRSLVSGLGTPEFLRVRLGVGRPEGRQDPVDYVLDAFPKKQQEEAMILAEEGADVVESLIERGLARTQDEVNRADR